MASALMAKMKMSLKDRPKVKAECLRLLASLKLDQARTTLIGGFIDSYLKLSAQEMKQYERRIAEFAPMEREATMEIVTSWHQAGIEEGLAQGITQGISQGKIEGLHEGKEMSGLAAASAAVRHGSGGHGSAARQTFPGPVGRSGRSPAGFRHGR